MRVYQISGPEKYEWVTGDEAGTFWADLNAIEDQKVADSWEPLEVTFLRKDGRYRFPKYSDLPRLSISFLVVRSAVLSALRPILEPWGELLPLKCEEDYLHLFNPTQIIDALNWEASRVHYFRDGRVMCTDAPVFYPDKLKDAKIFKLAKRASGRIYFTDSAVKEIIAAGCKGILFEAVWDSELGSFKDLDDLTKREAEIFVP